MRVVATGETPSLTGELTGETHKVLEHIQTHPLRNQHQKGPICLWVLGEVTESHQELSEGYCSLTDTSTTYSTTMQQNGLLCPGENLRLLPLQCNRCTETKNSMAQMKEQIKSPKIELSNEGIANLSDAQFKTLVIRMFTELVGYGHKIEEKMK